MSESNDRAMEMRQTSNVQTDIENQSISGADVYDSTRSDSTTVSGGVDVYERPERSGPSIGVILVLLILVIVAAFIVLQLIR